MAGRRVCVIREYYFPLDPRVRREVEALVSAQHSIDVICMRRPGERMYERRGTVSIWRLPMRHKRSGPRRRLYEYAVFAFLAGLMATLLCLRRRFDLVQVHSLPDTLVFAAALPKLLGVPVLLDLHECMPEFLASTFGVGPDHPAVKAVAFGERASIRFADFAMTCTQEMKKAFVGRGSPSEKIAVIMNSADESVFSANGRPVRARRPDELRLVHHGTIEERYGIDTAIRAVAAVRPRIPGIHLTIYGDGSQREELRALVSELGVGGAVSFSDGFVPLEELVDAIAASDGGVVAMKRDPFRDLTHCNKMYDLISMRRPVLCSRTQSVMNYFPESCFAYFEPDDPQDLARAILALHENPALAARLVEHAAEVNEPYRWIHQRERYLRIVEALTDPDRRGGQDTLRQISLRPPDYLAARQRVVS
jgi:glycosyltransferase involved in cell wall biosynthesis